MLWQFLTVSFHNDASFPNEWLNNNDLKNTTAHAIASKTKVVNASDVAMSKPYADWVVPIIGHFSWLKVNAKMTTPIIS